MADQMTAMREAPAPLAREPVKFKLSRPLLTHDGLKEELELNQPTITSFLDYGAPWKEYTSINPKNSTEKRTHFEFNYSAVMGFVSDMTKIDLILLSKIEACDMEPLAMTVMGVVATRNPL